MEIFQILCKYLLHLLERSQANLREWGVIMHITHLIYSETCINFSGNAVVSA